MFLGDYHGQIELYFLPRRICHSKYAMKAYVYPAEKEGVEVFHVDDE